MVALIAAVILVAAGQLPPPGSPPRDQPRSGRPDATQTATLRGRVTDRESGAPLPDVLVLVVPVSPDGDEVPAPRDRGPRLDQSRRTDDAGFYEFKGLPAGTYRLSFTPSESRGTHLAQNFGSDGPVAELWAQRRARLALRAGETKDDASIALWRGLAIEGRVIDERGQPVANADVTAQVADGPKDWRPSGRSRLTDDRGVFRLFGLRPAIYRVCAVPSPDAAATDGDNDRLLGACHPDDTKSGAGAAITLASKDVGDVVIQLRRSRTFTVRGLAIDASGAPIERGYIHLLSAGVTFSPSWSIEFVGGGNFIGRSMTPGDYLVLVDSDNTPPDRPDERARETGYAPLHIGAADVDGMVVTTAAPTRLAGRLRVEGNGALRPTGLRVTSEIDRRQLPISLMPGDGSPVAEDFTFEIRNLWGPRLLNVTGLPTGWIVKSIVYRGDDVTDAGVEFKASADASPLEIVVTSEVGGITGRVAGTDGSEQAVLVVFVPADPKRRTGAGLKQVRVRDDGMFDSGALRPGDYIAAVVDRSFARLLYSGNHDAMDRLSSAGTRVTAVAGERQHQDLRMVTLR